MQKFLFDLFPSINTIFVNAYCGPRGYPFSLPSFLSLIRGTKIEKVTIDTYWQHIPELLSADPRYIEIKKKYNQEQYQITEDWQYLIINKY